MRWLFAAGAVVCGVLLFIPLGGNSTWGSAGICGSALGQYAQHYSAVTQSNCTTDQVSAFVLGLLLLAFLALAVMFQVRHAARRGAASTGALPASGMMLSQHLAHCDLCKRDLPCDEWDKLYDGPAAVGSERGLLRERLLDHLSACDRCDKDLPCVKWDELYTTYEAAGGVAS